MAEQYLDQLSWSLATLATQSLEGAALPDVVNVVRGTPGPGLPKVLSDFTGQTRADPLVSTTKVPTEAIVRTMRLQARRGA